MIPGPTFRSTNNGMIAYINHYAIRGERAIQVGEIFPHEDSGYKSTKYIHHGSENSQHGLPLNWTLG